MAFRHKGLSYEQDDGFCVSVRPLKDFSPIGRLGVCTDHKLPCSKIEINIHMMCKWHCNESFVYPSLLSTPLLYSLSTELLYSVYKSHVADLLACNAETSRYESAQ